MYGLLASSKLSLSLLCLLILSGNAEGHFSSGCWLPLIPWHSSCVWSPSENTKAVRSLHTFSTPLKATGGIWRLGPPYQAFAGLLGVILLQLLGTDFSPSVCSPTGSRLSQIQTGQLTQLLAPHVSGLPSRREMACSPSLCQNKRRRGNV